MDKIMNTLETLRNCKKQSESKKKSSLYLVKPI